VSYYIAVQAPLGFVDIVEQILREVERDRLDRYIRFHFIIYFEFLS
jgi:hypothetical protein